MTSQSDRRALLPGTGLISNAARRQFDFTDDRYEWRRLFSELFGTFLLVLAAAGGRW